MGGEMNFTLTYRPTVVKPAVVQQLRDESVRILTGL